MSNSTQDLLAGDVPRPFAASIKEEIYLYVLNLLRGGNLEIGDLLPSTRDLARKFGKSITPVHQAISRLEQEGYVKRIHGSGVRVNARSFEEALVKIRPAVDLVTTLRSLPAPEEMFQASRHILPAVQQWLFWRLSSCRSIRLTVSTVVPEDDEELFIAQLRDALILRPKVVVFADPEKISDQVAEYLLRLHHVGVRVVYLATRRDITQLDRVHLDFADGQYQLTQHLLRNGHRCILRLRSAGADFYEQAKQDGFIRALKEYGLAESVADEWTVGLENIDAASTEQMAALLKRVSATLPFTAIMANNDPTVAPLRIATRKLGFKKIVITGYDNDWDDLKQSIIERYGSLLKDTTAPASVDTCLPKVGEALADLVLDRISNALPPGAQTRIIPQMMVQPGDDSASRQIARPIPVTKLNRKSA